MKITKTSVLSGITRTRNLPITQEQYDVWQKGGLIQNVMGHLSAGDREWLISGATEEEWNELFEENEQ